MLTALALAALVAGPIVQSCPSGVPVVRDAAALRAGLSAEGTRELWIAGRIEGDFEASGRVALHGCERALLAGSRHGTVLRLKGDDVLVEDIAFEGSGERVSSEDGALKVSGERARIRRVAVRDSLYGIALEQCHACTLEDSRVEGRIEIERNQRGDGIKLWESHGSRVLRNVVHDVRDVVVWYSRQVTLAENQIQDGRYGTHFMYAHDATVRGNVLRGNTVGVFVMYSARLVAEDNQLSGARGPAGMGIGFKESDAVTLRRNSIVANTVGIYLDSTPRNPDQPAHFEANALALNGLALRLHGTERGASFRRNDFLDNDELVEIDGNGDAREALFAENFWQAYAGYDLDHDGTGDVAFQVKRASGTLREAHPDLRYFHGTLALGLYDAVAFALPYFGARVVLQDDRPSMRRHRELEP